MIDRIDSELSAPKLDAAPIPIEPLKPRLRRLAFAAFEGAVVGLLLGGADVHTDRGDTESAYLVAGLLLGARHSKYAWSAWPPLAASLYVVHLVAIANGYRQPYVEKNYFQATFCLEVATGPSLVGLCLGIGARYALSRTVRYLRTVSRSA